MTRLAIAGIDEPYYVQLRGGKHRDEAKEYLWRYDVRITYQYSGRQHIRFQLSGYQIVRETEKGYWILKIDWYGWSDKEPPQEILRFVLKYDHQPDRYPRRRWAYRDKDAAWESFKIRKARQHMHLERQLTNAQKINRMITEGQMGASFYIQPAGDFIE